MSERNERHHPNRATKSQHMALGASYHGPADEVIGNAQNDDDEKNRNERYSDRNGVGLQISIENTWIHTIIISQKKSASTLFSFPKLAKF